VREQRPGLESHLPRKRNPISQIAELATAITAADTITVELVEADETPAVVIVRWPVERTVLHPRRFPSTAEAVARTFATAAVRLAAIKRERRL
jgi:hypothetical protein